MKRKKILVTGGAGFIGSHLVDKLIEKGNKVVVVDDLAGGFKRNVNPKAMFYEHDLRNIGGDKKDIYQICQEFKPEIIFHLAANAAENKAQFSPVDITRQKRQVLKGLFSLQVLQFTGLYKLPLKKLISQNPKIYMVLVSLPQKRL